MSAQVTDEMVRLLVKEHRVEAVWGRKYLQKKLDNGAVITIDNGRLNIVEVL
jgi:hypothetical protein